VLRVAAPERACPGPGRAVCPTQACWSGAPDGLLLGCLQQACLEEQLVWEEPRATPCLLAPPLAGSWPQRLVHQRELWRRARPLAEPRQSAPLAWQRCLGELQSLLQPARQEERPLAAAGHAHPAAEGLPALVAQAPPAAGQACLAQLACPGELAERRAGLLAEAAEAQPQPLPQQRARGNTSGPCQPHRDQSSWNATFSR
jgi:hypothetical protein